MAKKYIAFQKYISSFECGIVATLFVMMTTLMMSCGHNDFVLDQTNDVQGESWCYADTFNYTLHVADTSKLYKLSVGIAHAKKYANQNLYVRIFTRFPDGKRLEKLVNFDLADPSGKWLSDCGSNDCVYEVPIQEEAFFNKTGDYTFTIAQFMRTDSLTGIKAVSFRVADTGKVR